MLILVTGASRGIGYEMVKNLAARKNTQVIAVTRNPASLLKLVKDHNTHAVLPIKADISKAEDLKKIVKTIARLQMPLDVLINNAGELINKPFEKINDTELQRVYNANVFAPFRLIRTLLPFMKGQNQKHIVNIGSMGGFQGSAKFPGLSAYTSSKGALAVLSECLAEEFKSLNISVNCLALGSVQTEMLNAAFPGYLAPLKAQQMAHYICDFALSGHHFYNGKILPVSSSTP
jgi:3-oxoacyl-[acyl-carrier protein] reductase